MKGDIVLIPLYSSSEGNSTLVKVNGHSILIDLGKNCKQCTIALQKAGVYPDDIEAIFLTHQHSDHISGVNVFMRKHSTPVYGTAPTLKRVGEAPAGLFHPIEEKSVTDFPEFSMRVLSYPTYHDTAGSVIYRVENTRTNKSVCVMTDLGVVTEGMLEFCNGCNGGLFESNYDLYMLDNGPYDYKLKKRIKGNGGHISNDECGQLLEFLLAGGTDKFILGHISPHNNTPDIARNTVVTYLKDKGYIEGTDYEIQTASRFGPVEGIEI